MPISEPAALPALVLVSGRLPAPVHESFIDARFLGEKGLSEEISQGISGVHQTRCLRTGPHHVQEACPTVNCVWGNPNATYVHLAARECVVRCAKDPARCPYATSRGSSVSLLASPGS